MDTKLLSFEELGAALGIKSESARKLAARKRWRKVTANDGTSRIHVPVDELPSSGKDAGPVPDESQIIAARLESQIAGLREIVEAEKGRADTEAKRADAAEARLIDLAADRDAWRSQAQRSFWQRWVG